MGISYKNTVTTYNIKRKKVETPKENLHLF